MNKALDTIDTAYRNIIEEGLKSQSPTIRDSDASNKLLKNAKIIMENAKEAQAEYKALSEDDRVQLGFNKMALIDELMLGN